MSPRGCTRLGNPEPQATPVKVDDNGLRCDLCGWPALTPDESDRRRRQGQCLDKGYDYGEARGLAREFGYTAPIRARGEEARKIKREVGFKARRWVVERTHSWMDRFRRILTRWEKRLENYLGFLHLACTLICYRAAGLLR